MTTRILRAMGVATLLVVFGPGIGVDAGPGDPSASWVGGLVLLGATMRLAPLLAPLARRARWPSRQHAAEPVLSSALLQARTQRQRQRYVAGVVSAAYADHADAAETFVRWGEPTRVPVGVLSHL